MEVDLTQGMSSQLQSGPCRWWPTSFCHGLGLHPLSSQGSSKKKIGIHFVIAYLCQTRGGTLAIVDELGKKYS